MSQENNIINNFGDYSSWVSGLKDIDEKLWSTPISEGKWSVAEIIAHIINWDKHLLSEVLPAVRDEKGMVFPDFDTYNKIATDYVKTGISQAKLIEEAIETRERLVNELHEMPVEKLKKHSTANGAKLCPHTATPYSLIYIVMEFTDHDEHHKKQIIQFLKDNKPTGTFAS